MTAAEDMDNLIHDVGSKCQSLADAAGLLRKAGPAEKSRLLRLMAMQAQSLAQDINDFRQQRGDK